MGRCWNPRWRGPEAARERERRLELRLAERRLGIDSTDSGTPSAKERIGAKEARVAQTEQAAREQVAAARQERNEAVRRAESWAAGAESRAEQAEARTMPVIAARCLR